MKFKIKVPEVEAMHFTEGRLEHLKDFVEEVGCSLTIEKHSNGQSCLGIRSLNQYILVSIGDWIIKEPSGEIRTCSPEDFIKLYEPVEESHENN